MRSTVMVLFALLAATTATSGQALSASELKGWCDSSRDSEQNACLSYLSGFVAGYELGQETVSLGYEPICLPKIMSALDAKAAYQQILADQPALASQFADMVMLKALHDLYKCAPGQKPRYLEKSN